MNAAPDPLDADTDEDPRLLTAAQEYLAALEAGRRPDREEFIARRPDLAERLGPYLDAIDMVHSAGPALLRSPAKAAVEPPPSVEPLGDFSIVREIGRGGMGVVYEAVQLSLGRRVALKVLPFASALDARQLQRFKNEAQAAAQLHHTNIVPVYAVGCDRATHYYAMQLIEGQNLADLIAELRSAEKVETRSGFIRSGAKSDPARPDIAASDPALPPTGPDVTRGPKPAAQSTVQGPAAELSTQHASRSAQFYRTAAKLTAQAADALEHAHQFDVIHRDVKPANLIVDERGNVWVTDFGLAQFHTSEGLTRTGDMMGTLRYMSPEQAAGNHALLDARTDVYSLGATFYELLTLRPMFDGADAQRLLRQILHDEPRLPRSIDRSIPPELETIVNKAVGKNPTDRYASARAFAEDLRRFLDNRPILARPPSLAHRARKLGRRHPSVVVAALVFCALTTAGSLVGAWMIHQEKEKTLQRAKQAEEGLQLARQSADEMIQISEQELAGKPFTENARRRMLASALVYYQGLIAQLSDDPNAQAELESTQENVKKTLADLAVLQGGATVDLLNRDDVKDDLALSGDQRARQEELHRSQELKRKEGFPAFFRMTPDQRQEQALDEARAKEATLDKLLTQPQQRRLKQIALQLKPWLSAFHDPDVVKELKLTAAQKDGLRLIEAESFGPRPDNHRGPPSPGNRSEPRFRLAMEKFLAVLAEDQKERWVELTGKPFKASQRPFGPRPGGEPNGPPPGPPG